MYLENCPLACGERFEKIAGSPGRVVTLDELERRTAALLHKVPITRISEISRLVPSAAPVFSATTPMALDLTTHMGKGPDRRSARMSAVMEAIERVSAENFKGPVVTASHAGLVSARRACVDPQAFDLPPDTEYHPDLLLDWAEGWDLIGRRPVLVPVDLCISPPRQGLLGQVDTNGLASGATYGEAIRHALLEVIERDATGQHLFAALYGRGLPARPIPRDSLPASSLELLERIEAPPAAARLLRLEGIVPVVACLLTDPAYPAETGPATVTFGGWGCEVRLEHAINRALAEACQSRVGAIHGTRDSFNLVEDSGWNVQETPTGDVAGSMESDNPETGSIARDAEIILDRLTSEGFGGAVAVDLTDPSLGIPVVRVRVPGLCAFMVDRRRVGWRCMRHLL